jgi:hypothetical protein
MQVLGIEHAGSAPASNAHSLGWRWNTDEDILADAEEAEENWGQEGSTQPMG